MFQYRSSSFGPSVNAIQNHLGAVEKELEKIGRIAGRRGSAAASAAGEQIGETISTVLSDMIERFRARGEAASDRAARLGSQALKLGAGYGSDALCAGKRPGRRPPAARARRRLGHRRPDRRRGAGQYQSARLN